MAYLVYKPNSVMDLTLLSLLKVADNPITALTCLNPQIKNSTVFKGLVTVIETVCAHDVVVVVLR